MLDVTSFYQATLRIQITYPPQTCPLDFSPSSLLLIHTLFCLWTHEYSILCEILPTPIPSMSRPQKSTHRGIGSYTTSLTQNCPTPFSFFTACPTIAHHLTTRYCTTLKRINLSCVFHYGAPQSSYCLSIKSQQRSSHPSLSAIPSAFKSRTPPPPPSRIKQTFKNVYKYNDYVIVKMVHCEQHHDEIGHFQVPRYILASNTFEDCPSSKSFTNNKQLHASMCMLKPIPWYIFVRKGNNEYQIVQGLA